MRIYPESRLVACFRKEPDRTANPFQIEKLAYSVLITNLTVSSPLPDMKRIIAVSYPWQKEGLRKPRDAGTRMPWDWLVLAERV